MPQQGPSAAVMPVACQALEELSADLELGWVSEARFGKQLVRRGNKPLIATSFVMSVSCC